MQKIPTVFERNWAQDPSRVTAEVNPQCQWVLAGEGVATRKYDGTCVMFDGERWWARREVKAGRQVPSGFQAVSADETTGKVVGWEPIEASPFRKTFAEAEEAGLWSGPPESAHSWSVGTYELVGPKVNGNPEKAPRRILMPHADAEQIQWHVEDPEDVATLVSYVAQQGWEGVVFHHPDGRMAKIKARDYGITPGGPK